ncbi:hypothetical protein [Cellvibrio sp. QJXJ]|uniref:hypothetical protein n=1 Tax=Cellvibrio sp. QJXJ TaxID=2964606 RepID=UPI0021C40F87|nr:hypothetical protein [Cellvibrio sp. QJXJ]UUA71736.1 hypothetical protein NNX04_15080 [Cellvibrio sp. QJXJ]
MFRKTSLFASLFSTVIFLSPSSEARTPWCPMAYSPQFLECMAAYERRNGSVEEVVVIGVRPPTSTAGSDYLLTSKRSVPRDMQGRAVDREQFCRTEEGHILSTKANCELSAAERDETRQRDHCSNISLSWNGIGWTNPCRDNSALTYRTDMARCQKYYQDNMNGYNAICRR